MKHRLRRVIALLRLETYSDDKGIVRGAEGQIAVFSDFLSKRRHMKKGRHRIMVPTSMFVSNLTSY